MEIEDAIHTALMTLKEGFEGKIFVYFRPNGQQQHRSGSDQRRQEIPSSDSQPNQGVPRRIAMRHVISLLACI
jgi:hypothetical protein